MDEEAVENQDQIPADPQEPLEETVESCLLQVMQGGGHSWYMMVYVGICWYVFKGCEMCKIQAMWIFIS